MCERQPGVENALNVKSVGDFGGIFKGDSEPEWFFVEAVLDSAADSVAGTLFVAVSSTLRTRKSFGVSASGGFAATCSTTTGSTATGSVEVVPFPFPKACKFVDEKGVTFRLLNLLSKRAEEASLTLSLIHI